MATTLKTPLVGLNAKARPGPALPATLTKLPVDDAALKSVKVLPKVNGPPRLVMINVPP